LVVASTTGIMADPPKGLKLIPNETIDHPVFGKMKVISHGEDLAFYKEKVKEEDPFGNNSDEAELLAQNFIKYVLNADSLKQANVQQKDKQCEGFSQENIKWFVRDVISKSAAGMAMLKVITANYMREYDRIKQFCEGHRGELETCYAFSQTGEGKALYEKERQIFELEEKLKDLLWATQSERLESQFSKSGISSDDLKNLYEYFRKEEEVFNKELKESWIQLRKEDSEGFSIEEKKDYEPFCKLYEHFFKKNDNKELTIHYRPIKHGSERYKKLQKFVGEHKMGFERFFYIGDLCLAGEKLLRGSSDEWCCRNYYSKHIKDLEQLSSFRQEKAKLLETAKSVTKSESLVASLEKLEGLYKEETEKANKEKFSCIRRSVIPACYFPILYRHFFIENASEYANIQAVNKFLYRALKFKNAEAGCFFDWRTLSVIGNWDEEEKIQNYHANDQSEFSDCDDKNQTTPLQHELMHFMNAIDDLSRLKACEKISEKLVDNIIKTNGITYKLEIQTVKPEEDCLDSEEEEEGEKLVDTIKTNGIARKLGIQIVKPEKDCSDSEEEESKEEESKEKKDYGDRCITKLLRKLYDNGGEMWAMYGVCICEDKQNPGKYTLYYDPINEAVANAEALQVVRTGHAWFKNEDPIDPDDEESPLEIEVLKELDKKIGIYNFYFSKGETLRELIQ